MAEPASDTATLAVSLERDDTAPLSVQLYRQVRDLILGGRLTPGQRLPSSRSLAAELGVSRTTTVTAFDQLAAEGFVEGRHGSGAFVAELPLGLPKVREDEEKNGHRLPIATAISGDSGLEDRPFDLGLPDATSFPSLAWSRALSKSWRRPGREMFLGAPGGYPPLRRAIADHLRIIRGVPCDWRQVIVTASATESIELVARGLLLEGDAAWIEDPGYTKTRGALATGGLRSVPVPVDGDGLDVEAGKRLAPEARLAIVTPSRQFPLGMTMSLARRLALLDWASAVDTPGRPGRYVIEDDYDSEFRYAGRPIAPLAGLERTGLERAGRVLYLGSFSKVMFRALRLGYLVAPPAALDDLLAAQRRFGGQASMVAQPALAEFIAGGGFAAHIRRMRRLYASRQRALLGALKSRLGGLLTVEPQDFGMHLVATFAGPLAGADDTEIAERCAEAGIDVPPLSGFYRGDLKRSGLLLGYAGWPEEELEAAVEQLAMVLRAAAS